MGDLLDTRLGDAWCGEGTAVVSIGSSLCCSLCCSLCVGDLCVGDLFSDKALDTSNVSFSDGCSSST